MGAFWINKYQPLARTAGGRAAALQAGEPAFVDGSHRREPYLSPNLATISAICRGRNFAPRLAEGSTVVYLTTKDRYPGDVAPTTRLTAVLRVVRRFSSHASAAAWFRRQGIPIPPNCMVPGSHGAPAGACRPCTPEDRELAEARYRRRVQDSPDYFVCEPRWLQLDDPPTVSDDAFVRSLGYVPRVRTPRTWDQSQVTALLAEIGIPPRVISPKSRATAKRLQTT